MEITANALLDPRHPSLHLGGREIAVPVVDRLELAAVDRNARLGKQTKAYATSSGERKKIERLFGEAKSILSMVRLRLRGLTGARDEFLLIATVQNLCTAPGFLDTSLSCGGPD